MSVKLDVQQARALVEPYTKSGTWNTPMVLSEFSQGKRVDFDAFLEALLSLAHLFGPDSRDDVENLVEWAPDAPAGTWLPDAEDALAAVLSLISDWEQGRMLPEGQDAHAAQAFAALLSSVVEASGTPAG